MIRIFNGPFKWDLIKVDRAKLGKAEGLVAACFGSDVFWSGLKKSH